MTRCLYIHLAASLVHRPGDYPADQDCLHGGHVCLPTPGIRGLLRAIPALVCAATALSSSHAFVLNHTYRELADTAARLYALKEQGYSLEDVMASIQEGWRGIPAKRDCPATSPWIFVLIRQ